MRTKYTKASGARRVEGAFREDVHTAARDRWQSVLLRCGVAAEALTGLRTTCSACGGAFKFLDAGGRGTFVCRAAGRADAMGDGFGALAHLLNLNHAEAVKKAGEALGLGELPKARRASHRDWCRTGLYREVWP